MATDYWDDMTPDEQDEIFDDAGSTNDDDEQSTGEDVH